MKFCENLTKKKQGRITPRLRVSKKVISSLGPI